MATPNRMLRHRLEDELNRLSLQLEQVRASRPTENRREGSPFGKREEEAAETSEFENRMALEKRVLDQLAGVEHALSKFKNKTYGSCEECGQPIDPARLEALPQATQCMSCKAAQAKNAKGK